MKRAAFAAVALFVAGGCSRRGADEHTAARPPAPSSSTPTAAATALAIESSTPTAAAAAAGGPPADLNVVLITIDSLRADMPWHGYPRDIAPRLSAVAARGVDYTHAYALSSYTSMSLGGLLAGRLPSELKRDGYFFGTYGKDNVMFPEVLHDAGVLTLGGHGHGYFKDARFDQGFDEWKIVQGLKWNNTTDENVTAPQLEDIAEKLLADPRSESHRFFAWFHFMDPHDQYLAHPGIGPYGKTLRDRYDAEVTFTDQYVARLLDFLGTRPFAARTAVVLTADHGEAFGEHKQYAHGFELWENLVRVPLVFVVPGAAPRKIEEPRSALDLAPTICALLGVAPSPTFEGKSLVAELYGAPAEARDVAVDLPATSDNDRRRALVHGHLKAIGYGAPDLTVAYDLAADPEEATPLKGEAAKEVVARYKEFWKGVVEVPPYQCKEGCLNGGYLKKDGGS